MNILIIKRIAIIAFLTLMISSEFLLNASICGTAFAADTERTNEADEVVSTDNKNTSSSKTALLALPDKINNAWEMKSFKLPTTEGELHALSDWKGSVIMLNFWASWCAPCQFEIPRFVRYQETFSHRGLQVIGIGLDEARKLKNVERSFDMNYPTLVISQDKGADLLKTWGNEQQVVPYTVVIAKDGTIVYIHRGVMEDEAFNHYVLPLLAAEKS